MKNRRKGQWLITEYSSNPEIQALIKNMESVCAGSKANQKLAHFISNNYTKIVFMTAGQLADEVGVSQGSVSRFCMAMKFKGYNDFINNLQSIIRKELTLPNRLELVTHAQERDDQELFEAEHNHVEHIRALVKSDAYLQLVEKAVAAKNIVLLSARLSSTMLPYAFYTFNKIRDGVTQITPDSPFWDTISVLPQKTTLILAFAFPRYCNQLLEKIRFLNSNGYDLVVITDSNFLSIKGFVNNYISVPINKNSMFDIYSSPMLFLNLFVRDVAKRMKNIDKRIHSLEEAEEANNVYFKE